MNSKEYYLLVGEYTLTSRKLFPTLYITLCTGLAYSTYCTAASV